MEEHVFKTGGLWEEFDWKYLTDLTFDTTVYNFNNRGEPKPPCPHCRLRSSEDAKDKNGKVYGTKHTWVCSRVVQAFNEAGCNSTGVCIDCVLEAHSSLQDEDDRWTLGYSSGEGIRGE